MNTTKTILVTGLASAAIGFGAATVMPEPAQPADPQVKSDMYTSPQRNYDNIQYEVVRRPLDPLYNAVHDELSEAYYNGKPFRDKGVLTKEAFESYQAALWAEYEMQFATEMAKLGQVVPEEYQDGATQKANLLLEGYELTF